MTITKSIVEQFNYYTRTTQDLKNRIAKLKSLLNSLTEDKDFFREAIQSDIELIYKVIAIR
tara:strand:+ start:376 stop:558 length:183 start_codon:yes stop_codon:yes gene_type:complete